MISSVIKFLVLLLSVCSVQPHRGSSSNNLRQSSESRVLKKAKGTAKSKSKGGPNKEYNNLDSFSDTFTMPRASRFLAPDTTPENMGDPTLIGTLFIWEDQQIFDADGQVPLVGTRVSGTCTRVTATQEGLGSCQLIFVDDTEFTINVNGLLEGPFGSSLAIVGGTGDAIGLVGQMDFFPIFNQGESNGDVFINITRYEVDPWF